MKFGGRQTQNLSLTVLRQQDVGTASSASDYVLGRGGAVTRLPLRLHGVVHYLVEEAKEYINKIEEGEDHKAQRLIEEPS